MTPDRFEIGRLNASLYGLIMPVHCAQSAAHTVLANAKDCGSVTEGEALSMTQEAVRLEKAAQALREAAALAKPMSLIALQAAE